MDADIGNQQTYTNTTDRANRFDGAGAAGRRKMLMVTRLGSMLVGIEEGGDMEDVSVVIDKV